MVFRDPPFMYLGDEEGFIASMLEFVGGEMPKEWDEVYREIHRNGGREWEVFESKLLFDSNYSPFRFV
jgi:hypothetical protein